MKNIINLIISSMIIFSCSPSVELSNDINVIIKTETERINLKEKTFERFYQNGSKKVSFELSEENNKKVIDYLRKNKFLLEDKKYSPSISSDEYPSFLTEVNVNNGNKIFNSVYCSSCKYTSIFHRKVLKIISLVDIIQNICYEDSTVSKLAESDLTFD